MFQDVRTISTDSIKESEKKNREIWMRKYFFLIHHLKPMMISIASKHFFPPINIWLVNVTHTHTSRPSVRAREKETKKTTETNPNRIVFFFFLTPLDWYRFNQTSNDEIVIWIWISNDSFSFFVFISLIEYLNSYMNNLYIIADLIQIHLTYIDIIIEWYFHHWFNSLLIEMIFFFFFWWQFWLFESNRIEISLRKKWNEEEIQQRSRSKKKN